MSNSSEAVLRCACNEVVIKSRNGEEIIRAKVLILKGNFVYAVCKKCDSEVELPLKKADPSPKDLGPELYLDK